MKTLKLFLAIVLIAALGANASAQTVTKASVQQKTETFKVWGKCDMCKTRIEKTVKAEGVTIVRSSTLATLLAPIWKV